jgi:hypothetical protein
MSVSGYQFVNRAVGRIALVEPVLCKGAIIKQLLFGYILFRVLKQRFYRKEIVVLNGQP